MPVIIQAIRPHLIVITITISVLAIFFVQHSNVGEPVFLAEFVKQQAGDPRSISFDRFRRRIEVQENSFKRMKEHGALDVNFGTKTIFSEDRRQARKKETLEKSSAAIRGKIEKKESGIALQEGKVGESKEKGHGKRLSQRENKLAELRGELDGLE